jgi:hypothetical protein
MGLPPCRTLQIGCNPETSAIRALRPARAYIRDVRVGVLCGVLIRRRLPGRRCNRMWPGLRHSLESGAIVAGPAGYWLVVDAADVEAFSFMAAAEDGHGRTST